MKSLTELNTYSNQDLPFTDNRPAGVIIDLPVPYNLTFTESNRVFTVKNTVNIVEIIKPEIANVRYKVNLGDVNASLSYPNLPAGITLSITQFGTIYTISGFTESQWDDIKNPTITLDPNYYGNFSYTVTILYDTETQADNAITWTVGVYAPQIYMPTSISTNIAVRQLFALRSNMLVSSNVSTEFLKGRLQVSGSIMSSTFSYSVEIQDLDLAVVNMSPNFTATITVRKFVKTSSNLQTRFTLLSTFTLSKAITNMNVSRSYTANKDNLIFSTNTPYIEDLDATPATYRIVLTATSGEWATGGTWPLGSIYDYTGTKTQVNSAFSGIRYFPDKNVITTITITYNQYKNNSLQLTKIFNLINVGTSPDLGQIYQYTQSGSTSWSPSLYELKYCKMDYLVIGGGGGGVTVSDNYNGYYNGPAGGGGEVLYLSNVSIGATQFTLSVGSGGTGQASTLSSGTNGGSSSFNGLISRGGLGGTAPSGAWKGGTSGNGYLGANVFIENSQSVFGGGAGGGASSSAIDGTYSSVGMSSNGRATTKHTMTAGTAGSGVTNNITGTNIEYGSGGPGTTKEGYISYKSYFSPSFITYWVTTTTFPSFNNNPGRGGRGGYVDVTEAQVVGEYGQPNYTYRIGGTGIAGAVIIKTHL